MSQSPKKRLLRILIMLTGVLILTTPTLASTHTNRITMPPTSRANAEIEVTPDSLKPAECNGATTLTAVSAGSGTITGSSGPDLVLGAASADTINGLAGDDCILSGAGTDIVDGGDGTDICIGTADTTFDHCEFHTP